MRILLKFISLFILFSISLFANIPNINECKSDLYYANGIMIKDSKKKAKIKWSIEAKKLFINNLEAFNKLGKIDISYNTSQSFVDDIYESFEQVMSNEWGWSEFSQYYRTYMEQTGFQIPDNTHLPDLNKQIEAYKQSIRLGHNVIVIAHSQGNYYTNEAYEELDGWMKNYFYMMGVATPANHVAGYAVDDASAPYVKFHNDMINGILTSLPSNRDNPNPTHNSVFSVAAHDFYESYLTAENTKTDIFNFILGKIQAHGDAPSQWETDQELNKGTEDYSITVKHRFDSSIATMNDKGVYPFAPSKKLYHVTDNTGGNGWVKASCGGEEVLDTWTGQDIATEYAKLVHTDTTLPHEILYFQLETTPILVSVPNKTLAAVGQIFFSEYWNGQQRTITSVCTEETIPVSNNNIGYWYGQFFIAQYVQTCEYVGEDYYENPRNYPAEEATRIQLLEAGFQAGLSSINVYLSTLDSYDISYGKIYSSETEKYQYIHLTNIKVVASQ